MTVSVMYHNHIDPTSLRGIKISLPAYARRLRESHVFWDILPSTAGPPSGIPRGQDGGWGFPLPEIPKAVQNHAKLNPIVKTLKIAEFRVPTPQDVQKKRQ